MSSETWQTYTYFFPGWYSWCSGQVPARVHGRRVLRSGGWRHFRLRVECRLSGHGSQSHHVRIFLLPSLRLDQFTFVCFFGDKKGRNDRQGSEIQ